MLLLTHQSVSILELYGGYQELFNVDNLQVSFDEYSPQYANTYLTTTGADQVHDQGLSGMGISVAVIDSGVANHPDLNNRLIASPFGSDDLYGHGTHVAGIIGGDANLAYGSYKGMAPGVNIINLLVTAAAGMAYESDVVNALQWVFENKEFYNIRVINLSLNSSIIVLTCWAHNQFLL